MTLSIHFSNLAAEAFAKTHYPLSTKTYPPDFSLKTEAEWVRLINQGDERAFEAMVKTYANRLYRFASHIVKSDAVAEELVQEVFCKVWEMRSEWSPQQSVKSYLYTAVRNQAIGYLRHRRFEVLLAEDDEIETPNSSSLDEELHAADFSRAVEQAIADLPDRCQLIFRMHREDGLTYVEIAKILGISIKTVETQMGRALRVLRQRLSPFLPLLLLFSAKALQ